MSSNGPSAGSASTAPSLSGTTSELAVALDVTTSALTTVITRRRILTSEMQDMADFLRVPV